MSNSKTQTIQPPQTIKSRVQTGRPAGSVDQPLIMHTSTANGQAGQRKSSQGSYSTHKIGHLSNGSIGGGYHKQSASTGGLSSTQNVSRSRKSLTGRSMPISQPAVNQGQKYSQHSSLHNTSAGGYQAPINVPKQKTISPGTTFK